MILQPHHLPDNSVGHLHAADQDEHIEYQLPDAAPDHGGYRRVGIHDRQGTGAIAVYKYNLKKRPYTLSIIMKDSTHMAQPMAWSAPCMSTTMLHISPPLKVWGDWVISCHISLNLSFHTSSAFSRFWTTQLSLTISSLLSQFSY